MEFTMLTVTEMTEITKKYVEMIVNMLVNIETGLGREITTKEIKIIENAFKKMNKETFVQIKELRK